MSDVSETIKLLKQASAQTKAWFVVGANQEPVTDRAIRDIEFLQNELAEAEASIAMYRRLLCEIEEMAGCR